MDISYDLGIFGNLRVLIFISLPAIKYSPCFSSSCLRRRSASPDELVGARGSARGHCEELEGRTELAEIERQIVGLQRLTNDRYGFFASFPLKPFFFRR